MIELLLPPEVISAEAFGDLTGPLLGAESGMIEHAIPSRRREFITGRVCARLALAAAGVPAQPILTGRWREPLWPSGIVGSITHCDGYRAAAVAHRGGVFSVGIDAEPYGSLPEGVLPLIGTTVESGRLAELSRGQHWDRIFFSAKEAAYKAWFSYTGSRLDADELSVTIGEGGTFCVLFPNREHRWGRWQVARSLVTTALVIADPRDTRPSAFRSRPAARDGPRSFGVVG